jgi:DNA-binding NtrC family response regulator
MPRQGTVLVIDDEELMREILDTLLTREGYRVRTVSSGAEGLDVVKSTPVDAVIVDVMMPGMDGLQVLDAIRAFDDDLPVLMITALASMETAVGAMKRGAFDYITKPFKNDEVLVVLGNAVERRRLVAENVSQVRQHHRRQPADEAGLRPRHPGRPEPIDHPDHGRERHRQGARGPRDPYQLVACRQVVRHRQLRQPAA